MLVVILKVNIDEVDFNILEILRRDARTPFTEIGRKLGISDATVHVRVKKMLKGGIIKRYTIAIDEKVFGRTVGGLALLNVTPGTLEEVIGHLLANEWISSIYEVHGPNDLILKLGAENLDKMRNQIIKIRETPNVITSELITIYKVWKEGSD